MNPADRLAAAGEGRRGNTVGFALTVLQRRLASSPEAIYQSLRRRRSRLEARVIEERQLARARRIGLTAQEERLSSLLGSDGDLDFEIIDELEGDEREDLEAEVVDAASAASTIEDLQQEIRILAGLESIARQLVTQGVDRKWSELSGLLSEAAEMFDPSGKRRKLIVFTEHRDTLNYLVDRLRTFLGSEAAVVAISGATGRDERRVRQQKFTHDKDCVVLVATDAAGEGINLQRAHLVVNYDLPWNPNRIEQRFGRVHRIGQEEVCHMWNLVAEETREAQVYLRLLDKMEELHARRLLPHYVAEFFRAALARLGGAMRQAEPGRFEITRVPEAVRRLGRQIGDGTPIVERYDRVTFDKEFVRLQGAPPAELLAPGHPLLTALIDLIEERHRHVLTQGATLVDDTDDSERERLMIMLEHAIADARPSDRAPHVTVSRRFEFVEIPAAGEPLSFPGAPYLDYRAVDSDEASYLAAHGNDALGADSAETRGLDHAIEVAVPEHLAAVRLHTKDRVERTRAAVRDRLTREINYWDHRANELRLQASAGKTPRMNPERADELAKRLEGRMRTLDQESALRPLPPIVVGAARVVPRGLIERVDDTRGQPPETFSRDTAEVERRAINAVLVAEAELGHRPRDMNDEQRNHPGYDIQALVPGDDETGESLYFIEVKGRIAGAATVTVSRNEILTGLNSPAQFILVLVEVSPDGPDRDRVRYIWQPFEGIGDTHFAETSRTFAWSKLWELGVEPSAAYGGSA